MDGAKKWPHRIGSRLLPYQIMSLPTNHRHCMAATFPLVSLRPCHFKFACSLSLFAFHLFLLGYMHHLSPYVQDLKLSMFGIT